MTAFLLALNLALAALLVVLSAVSVVRRRNRRVVEGPLIRGVDRSVADLLADVLSDREQRIVVAALAIACNPEKYQSALVSVMAQTQSAPPRARMALLSAIRAILRTRPELGPLCWPDPRADVRAAVVASLPASARENGTDAQASAVTSIIESGMVDPDPQVRRAAAANIRVVSGDRARAMVWRGLDDDDEEVQRHACTALIACIDATSIGPIVDRLATTDRARARRILQALARMDVSIVEPLVRLAVESRQSKLQVAALRAIGAVGVPTTCVDLLPLFHDDSPLIRRAAAAAVFEIARLADGRGIHADVVRGLVVQLSLEADTYATLALIDALEVCGDAAAVIAIVEKSPHLSAALRERGLEAVTMLQRRFGAVAPLASMAAHA